jgi:hypothetical protein
MCFSYYKSRKDPHPAVRAARGKYSVPTREFVAYRGGTGSRGASGRGVELAGPSPTPASRFSLSLSLSRLFLPPPMDRCGGGARAGGRRERQRVTEMVRPAGTPARSLPSAPGRCFSSFPLPMAGPGCATQRTTDFRPDAGALQAYVTSVHGYIPQQPAPGCLTCVSSAPRMCWAACLLVTNW